jgi:hypothetical protein
LVLADWFIALVQLGPQEGLADTKEGPEGGGNRGQLFTQIVRVLKAKTPRAFLLENVPGLLHCDGGKAMGTIVRALEVGASAICDESRTG